MRKTVESNPHPNCIIPAINETQVYRLGESLMNKIGINKFEAFINNELPL